jgi:hypothetical protein
MVSHLTDPHPAECYGRFQQHSPYSEALAMRPTSDSMWVVIYSFAVAVFILAYLHIPA